MPSRITTAPPSAARPVNLRTTVRLVDDGEAWEQGIRFRPENCSTGYSLDPLCADPEAVGGKEDGDPPDVVEWDPIAIYYPDSCPYALNEEVYADLTTRARRGLEAQTSHLIEEALWSGTVDGVDFTSTHPNVALTQTADVGTPAPPVSALQQIDELLIAALGGRRGMIHVPMALMHQASFYNLLRREGPIWETVTGNVIVPGTGYSGTNPDNEADGDNLWIYGTSPVELRLGPPEVPGDLASSTDRATNQLVVRAERLALAYWDLCAHVGVPVCTTDPGPACESES